MKVVNNVEFNEITKEGIVLVDFFANWCGPCKALAPVLEELSSQYPNIEFIKVDVDESEQLAEQFNIMSIPTIYILKDGKAVARTGGFKELNSMKEFIDDTLNKL